jgi:predicted ABC-type ATPase
MSADSLLGTSAPPRMIVVAGPPGSGKSTVFPVQSFGVDFFNADDRAAELNNGSYHAIPLEIRSRVNREFEAFVLDHIRERTSFAIETTLRSDVTFRQAAAAKAQGFRVEMFYLALDNFDRNLKRVTARSLAGGHAAPAEQLRSIHRSSLANLAKAIDVSDGIQVLDNSVASATQRLLLEAQDGQITHLAEPVPEWLESSLDGTAHDVAKIRQQLRGRDR